MHSCPLITFDEETSTFVLHKEGLEILEKADETTSANTRQPSLGVISIVGPPSSGKSCVMNQLAKAFSDLGFSSTNLLNGDNQDETYPQGFSPGFRTRGIRIYDSCFWIGEQKLILLDTEGIESSQSMEDHTAILFSLVASISSMVILNTNYCESKEAALNSMSVLSQIPKHLISDDDDSDYKQNCAPMLMWLIHSFPKEKAAEGNNADSYMESLLKERAESTTASDDVKAKVQEGFPSRICQILLNPVDPNSEGPLKARPPSAEENELAAVLAKQTPAKQYRSEIASGTFIACFLEVFVDEANQGIFQKFSSVWETSIPECIARIAHRSSRRYHNLIRKCVKCQTGTIPETLVDIGFQENGSQVISEDIDVIELPCEEEALRKHEESVKAIAVTHFEKLVPSAIKLNTFRKYEDQIRKELQDKIHILYQANKEASYEHCSSILLDECMDQVLVYFEQLRSSVRVECSKVQEQVENLHECPEEEIQNRMDQIVCDISSGIEQHPSSFLLSKWIDAMATYRQKATGTGKFDALYDFSINRIHQSVADVGDAFAQGIQEVLFKFLHSVNRKFQELENDEKERQSLEMKVVKGVRFASDENQDTPLYSTTANLRNDLSNAQSRNGYLEKSVNNLHVEKQQLKAIIKRKDEEISSLNKACHSKDIDEAVQRIRQIQDENQTLLSRTEAANSLRQMYEDKVQDWKLFCSRIQSEYALVRRETSDYALQKLARQSVQRIMEIRHSTESAIGRANSSRLTIRNMFRVFRKMCQGIKVYKHNRGNHKKVPRVLIIQPHGRSLNWCEPGSEQQVYGLSESKGLPLSNIREIIQGTSTEAFQHTKKVPVEARCCFTLLTGDRSYDFEAENVKDAVDCVFFLVRWYSLNGPLKTRITRAMIYLKNVALNLPKLARKAGYNVEKPEEYLLDLFKKAKQVSMKSRQPTMSHWGTFSPAVNESKTNVLSPMPSSPMLFAGDGEHFKANRISSQSNAVNTKDKSFVYGMRNGVAFNSFKTGTNSQQLGKTGSLRELSAQGKSLAPTPTSKNQTSLRDIDEVVDRHEEEEGTD